MNAIIVTGEYLNHEGKTKKNYHVVGKLFIYSNSSSLKLFSYPANNETITFYPIKKKDDNSPQNNNQQQNQNANYAPPQNNNQQQNNIPDLPQNEEIPF